MVTHGVRSAPEHIAHRVSIPSIARPVYKLAVGHVGSWDAGYFGLLVATSIFSSGAATLLFLAAEIITADTFIALLAAVLYLLSFAVANLFLTGLVDSDEAFFLLGLTWAMLTERWWISPPAMILGALTKEAFIAFAAVFCLVWAISSRPTLRKLTASYL